MGIPVPGETALVTAGIVASRGRLEIEVVIALAAAAAILGDNVGFAIVRKLGRKLLTAPGPCCTIAAGIVVWLVLWIRRRRAEELIDAEIERGLVGGDPLLNDRGPALGAGPQAGTGCLPA
jgi:uncharacterized membrane protein YfcA